jgi:glucose-6-phosphate 1-epimerase
MVATELNEQFGIPGALEFESTSEGLTLARITTPAAAAVVSLHGAHLTEWTPNGHGPVLFLSTRSDFAPGKPIRGGVPIIFPWFGPRSGQPAPPHSDQSGPSHGFARTSGWSLAFAALAGEDLHLSLTLLPNDHSREFGFDHFGISMRMRIGRTLSLEFAVANDPAATRPLVFEEALHTYYAVADATRVTVDGLSGVTYLDKRDNLARKVQADGPVALTGATDRVYLNTDSTCVIHDPGHSRRIVVRKAGSQSTVVWNPWSELSPGLPDMDPEGWRTMVCVETANVDANAITLAPGESHVMSFSTEVLRDDQQESA